MKSTNYATVFCLLLIASVNGAPTETPAGQANNSDTPTTGPNVAATTQAPSVTAGSSETASAPATDDATDASNTTSSMAVSSTHDNLGSNSSFTCAGRPIGYYGDVDHECKVYHFCLPGDYHGQTLYQRISYLCLNGTLFDQQQLDCVESSKVTAPCSDSVKYFEESNRLLREAIVGKQMNQGEATESS